MPLNNFSFGKTEKLCSKKIIEELFNKEDVHRIAEHPFLFIWKDVTLDTDYPAQVLITASKRLFPRAVDRNRVKRQMRELYRTNKQHLYDVLVSKNHKAAILLIYTDKQKRDSATLKKNFSKLFEKVIKNIEQTD